MKQMQIDISFILYKPAVAGNIGASARALKTMGFSNLRLISPTDHLAEEAKMMAHGSTEILEACSIYHSFDDAVSDLDMIISTTANTNKNAKVDYISSGQLVNFLMKKKGLIKKLGIVFGTEESGLPGEILRKSNAGLTIPSAVSYPSLNLSQAVMVIAYELFKYNSEIKPDAENTEQPDASWRDLQFKADKILEEINIKPPAPLYHRIIERMSFLKASDARLIHSISSKLIKYLKI